MRYDSSSVSLYPAIDSDQSIMTKTVLSKKQQQIASYAFMKQLQNLPFVEAILLFGSRARNTQRQNSDIDLAILCPSASNADWLLIMDVIDDADTLLKIDCIRYDTLNDQALLEDIKGNHVLLYQKEGTNQ
jgi:uncharacterized protein